MLAKERFSWTWVSALVLILGGYFTYVSLGNQGPEPTIVARPSALAVALGALAVVALAARFWPRRDEDAAFKADERDRDIDARASRYAYHVLMVGMILVGIVMPFSSAGWSLIHAALLAIASAEIVHHGTIVYGYRRGWRV